MSSPLEVASYAIAAVIILLSNLVCLVVFLTTKRLRQRRPFYILINLNIADFLVGVSILETISLELTAGDSHEVVSSTLYFLAGPASLYVLVSISVERFVITMFPLYRHRSTLSRLYFGLLGIPWFIASFVLTLYILSYKVHILDTSILAYARVLIVLSLTTIIINYTAIILKLKCRQRIHTSRWRERDLREQKLVVTLIIVTFVSLVTWTPYGVYATILFYSKNSKPYYSELFVALNWLRYLNSGINIVVYMFRMPDFKKAFLGICSKKCNRLEPRSRLLINNNQPRASPSSTTANGITSSHAVSRKVCQKLKVQPGKDLELLHFGALNGI